MIDIKDYYDEVLSKFNFSISGYTNIEKNLNDFFAHFVNSRSLVGKNHIDFISYGYSKLIDLDKWKLESTHIDEFFFNTFNERSSELLMVHEYYAFKNFLIENCKDNILGVDFSKDQEIKAFVGNKEKLKEVINYLDFTNDDEIKDILKKEEVKDSELENRILKFKIDRLKSIAKNISGNDQITAKKIKTSELAAKIFRKPTIYRIALIDEGHLEVRFDKHLGVLTIKIPFSELFSGAFEESRHILHKSFEEELLKPEINSKIQLLFKKSDNLYTKTGLKDPQLFIENLKILNPVAVKRTIKVLSEKLISLNDTANDKFFFEFDDLKRDLLMRSFSKLLVSHAYLSYLFNCWVENIPSVVDIDENTYDQRCLGTFILGYNMKEEISDSERTLFKITSDRISANLASNAIENAYPDIKTKRARNKQVRFLRSFRAELKNEFNRLNPENEQKSLHFFELCDNLKDWIREYSNKERKNLEYYGLTDFTKYIHEIIDHKDCHPGLLVEVTNIKEEQKDRNKIYQYARRLSRMHIKHNEKRSIVNTILPHYLIKEFQKESDKIDVEKIETFIEDGNQLFINCPMKFSDKFFSGLLNSITNNRGNIDEPGRIGTFINDNWNDIKILGNVKIGEFEEDNFVTVLDLKNDFSRLDGCLKYDGLNERIDKKVDQIFWCIEYYSI